MKKLFFALAVLMCTTGVFAQSRTKSFDYNDYNYRRRAMLEVLPVTENDIIFLGDDFIDGCEWSEILGNSNIKNRGIAGDKAAWVSDRMNYLLASKPKKLFIMFGINDLNSGASPEKVIADITKIVEMFQAGSPKTKIYVHSILPVNDIVRSYDSAILSNIVTTNTGLQKLCTAKKITYIDVYSIFKDATGRLNESYTTDGFNLNGVAYLSWADAIKKMAK